MHTVGIIAEYNPFHAGHAWQLAAARRMGAQQILVALSCGAVQRGELPFLPASVRAAAALDAGADLVLALPAPAACSGAAHFAAEGVRVLAAAGCDTLVCGTESLSAAECRAAAAALESPAFAPALQARLAGGARSFAAARQQALAELAGPALAARLHSPNDNLAVEYARAILAQKTPMTLVTLPRQGTDHHAAAPAAGYASASWLRAAWRKDGPAAAAPYVPAAAAARYAAAARAGLVLDDGAFSAALLARLRLLAAGGPAPFARVRAAAEGLDRALEKAVRSAATADQLYDSLTTVRYPRARIRRLALDAALGYTEAANAPVPYLHVLGARRGAMALLRGAALPADTSLARLARRSPACAAMADAQARAADLSALCRKTPGPMGLAYTTPCVWREEPNLKNV